MKSNNEVLSPFQRQILEKKLTEDLPKLYRQRIQIMLLADKGKSQIEICRDLRCSPATARHWIHIACSGMAHQWQASPIGRPKAVNQRYLTLLQELVNHHPRDYGYSFRRWTANWLSKHLAKELGIKVSECHIKRLLKQMGLSTKPKPEILVESTEQQTYNGQIFIADINNKNLLNAKETVPNIFLKFDSNRSIYDAH